MLQRGRFASDRSRHEGGARRRAVAWIWVAVIALLSASLLAGCGTPTLTNDPKNLFAKAEPATVLVTGEIGAHVSVPQWKLNSTKLIDELYNRGYTPYTAKWNTALLDLIVTDPISYLDPDYSSAAREMDASSAWWGSGFIADPNGYVVTNAHVAAPSDDDIKSELASQGLQKFVEEDLASLKSSGYFSSSRQQQLAGAFEQWMDHYLKLTNVTKKFSVVMGANIAGSDVTPKSINADVVTAGAAIPGKDVAILKIEGQNYPTLAIGDDSQTNVGDKLFVIGYPAPASGGENPVISEKSVTEPTFTSGVLSAKKQATEGFQVIQTDAAITHGNSGGPVLDANGNVVGIATFGSLDQSGKEVQGYNFIMPAQLVKQFLDRSGAKPSEGTFTKLYATGLAQESAGAYKDAKATFQQIEELSPGNPYVTQHVSQDEAAIASGKDKSMPVWLIPAAIVVALLVVVGIVVAIVMARRKKAPAMAAQGAYPGAQPLPGGPQPTPFQPAAAPYPAAPAAPQPAAFAAPVEEATIIHEAAAEGVTLQVTTPSGTRQFLAALPSVIGRGQDAQITLDDSEVSRHHVQLSYADGGIEVQDLGSSNGTKVNGVPITTPVLARKGDHIQVGQSDIAIE